MPFTRPTLTALRNQVSQDINAALPGADATLRFSNLKVTGDAQAGLAYLHYGYLDWIAMQAVPFTASGEYLEGWAALKGVYRLPASVASGYVTFTGTNGTDIPLGTGIVRGDGVKFTTTADVVVSAGTAIVPATSNADPTGLTGAIGNTLAGTVMNLASAIAGVQSGGTVSTAFTGGADLETDAAFRSRMLQIYQNPPQGGSQSDYITWALEVPGVTRAWAVPNGMGTGTVVVYVMLDAAESAHNGFPQGANGVAAAETRAVAATGDQLVVANFIFLLQPVTALVYVVAPIANPIAFSITGVASAQRAAVSVAIAGVFLREGVPGGKILLQHVWAAVASVSGVSDFVITSPAVDITNTAGNLPTVGTITWS